MISVLDTRYAERLRPIESIVGEVNFVYLMSVWAICYAECISDSVYLPQYTDRNELYRRVCLREQRTKHQLVALNQILEEDHPQATFHFGLTSEDIMANARWTQIQLAQQLINEELKETERNIREFEKQHSGFILGHTHGQPATPIKLGPYLRAKMRRVNFNPPEYRLGGSNGQLTVLRFATGQTDFSQIASTWQEKVAKVLPIDHIKITTPTEKVGLLQVGPSNEATILAAMGITLKLRALCRALWDHAQRKILRLHTEKAQAGSSAMPHKINPIDFENAEGAFSNAYHILQNALEANCDTRGLRDLSNSIVNRQMPEAWVYIYLGVTSLNRGMNKAEYDSDMIQKELKQNPECLSELYRYYQQVVLGNNDPYWQLKQKPPGDWDDTVSKMVEWEIK